MRRMIATRRLKRTCECGRHFTKGDAYYKHRHVTEFEGSLLSYEWLECPKCKYEREVHERRFEERKKNCGHPIVHEVWSVIPGEYVYEPNHEECSICGAWI